MGSTCSQLAPNAPDNNTLKILYYNVRSIVYKIDELSTNCSLYSPDVVCITETWLNESVLDSEVCIANYQLVRLDRDRHGGGIALYIANYLSFTLICSRPDTLEFLAISIKQPRGDVAIALLYRPPSSPTSYFDNLSKVLEDICIPMYSMFLLVGDYNVDISTHNHLSRNLLNLTSQHGLSAIQTDPTRVTSSSATTIDLVFTTSPSATKSCETIPPIGSSDHLGILATFARNPGQPNIQVPRRVWRYKYADYDLANDMLLALDPSVTIVDEDVSASCRNWNDEFMRVMELCIPHGRIPRRKNLPWLSKSIIQLIRKRNLLFKKSKTSPRYVQKYKHVRNKVVTLLRNSRKNFFKNLNPRKKAFWKAVKSVSRNSSEIPTLKSNNVTVATNDAKATMLSHTFCQNFNKSALPLTHADVIPIPRTSHTYIDSNLLCTEPEVFDLLASLDISKATGPDGISAQMLKYTAESITPIITALFNQSISMGIVPDQWKISLVVPIHKQGERADPSNYRPISLLPIISKVLEQHIASKLRSILSISDQQWGFMPGRSTTGAILSAMHDWHEHLDKGADVQAIFFDLQKAFDSVPHGPLIDKLISLNVPTALVSWISSYLYNRKQQVGVCGVNSDPVNVISGVPQGSVLGPLLFLIYIDGLTSIPLNGGSLVIFADDLLLHRVIYCAEDTLALQKDVDSLANWITFHHLTLNVRKCKSLLVSRKHSYLSGQSIYVFGQVLEKVESYKYLGVVINSTLTWSDHISRVCSRARQQLGLLYRQFYRDSSTSTLKALYITQVRPHLEYSTPVWDPHLSKDINALESVQRFASKVCTKKWRDVSYDERLKLLNIDTLQSRRSQLKLCYLYKIINGQAYFMNSPLSLFSSVHDTRSHNLTLNVPFTRSVSSFNSFFCRTTRMWNQLPFEVVSSHTFLSFKKALCNHTFT